MIVGKGRNVIEEKWRERDSGDRRNGIEEETEGMGWWGMEGMG